jgi:hypothetical protein
MSFFRNLLSALGQFFASKPKPALFFLHKPMGPRFTERDKEMIRIEEGELQGQEFRLTTEVSDDEAHTRLFRDNEEIGHCDIQRNTHEATVVLWNIVVQEQLRHKGLASIMAYTAFRKMLELYKTASFAIRMLRLIKPSDRITKIQNVGIGVIARKLGFSPEYDLEALLRQRNIQLVELISSDGIMPPGYRIVLKIFPLVLIAFLVDNETGKPFPQGHRIYNSLVTAETAETWVSDRMIIIGNGNYILKREGIEEAINHLGTNEVEAGIYARRVKPAG